MMRFRYKIGVATFVAAIFVLGVRPSLALTGSLGEIDVTQAPYNADITGAVDDTAVFQKALNSAAGSGAIVRVPAGQYKFTGSLTIPAHVVLEGVNDGERSYAGYMNGTAGGDVVANCGTVFLVTGGAGTTGPGFLSLKSNAAVRNVTFYYPNQSQGTSAGWTQPTAYPPTITLAGRNASVENVCGVNPYMFITSSSVSGVIRRVVGQPLYSGINIDNDADPTGQGGDRIEDVHFLNTWDSHPEMLQWMKAHSVGFVTCRADELAMRNCSCTGYLYGYAFNKSGSDTAYGTLISCSASNCAQAIRITACTAGAGGGLVFDGGGFGNVTDTAVAITNTNTGNVTFNSCRFFQSPGMLVTNASAPKSVVSLLACHFLNWGTSVSAPNASDPAVYCGDAANQSAASGKTRILSSDFSVDQYQYAYTPGEAGVLFENNSTVNGIRVQVYAGATPPCSAGLQNIQINNF